MLAQYEPCQGKRTLDCLRLGKLTRTSSNAMEMKEEQHVEIEKVKAKRKNKNHKK
jgi:hypothetical protein